MKLYKTCRACTARRSTGAPNKWACWETNPKCFLICQMLLDLLTVARRMPYEKISKNHRKASLTFCSRLDQFDELGPIHSNHEFGSIGPTQRDSNHKS